MGLDTLGDYVAVLDSERSLRLSGQLPQPPIYSRAGQMTVHFSSDHSRKGPGFKAEYEFLDIQGKFMYLEILFFT